VPLDTERGYHVEWDMAAPPLTRPSCLTERGFYLCPMTGRSAGGRDGGTWRADRAALAPPDRQAGRGRADAFPDLGPPDRDWMGFRPSMPDSLPVIGPSGGGDDVILAFGHGHLGMTLAPVTAGLVVADFIARRPPTRTVQALRPGRF
jgi:glycine/D-amino acid oxidase-like deaminating enzyme